jgi:hypothetical protein
MVNPLTYVGECILFVDHFYVSKDVNGLDLSALSLVKYSLFVQKRRVNRNKN